MIFCVPIRGLATLSFAYLWQIHNIFIVINVITNTYNTRVTIKNIAFFSRRVIRTSLII